jgi:hypothetical protein
MFACSRLALTGTFLLLSVACASTGFVSTWKAPDAQPLTNEGKKVAAVVMARNEATRRAAEDSLARELTLRGAEGVPMYTLLPDEPAANEAAAKAAVEKAGIAAVVVLRPIGSDKEVYPTPSVYVRPPYGWYWGGYYGYGWGAPWGGSQIRTDTIVTVETLVYSVAQNKLVWAGRSRTTNPEKVDSFVRELVNAAAREMKKQGLI